MPLDLDQICIEPLTDLHDRAGFTCSNQAIQNFCRGGLANAHRTHTLRAFVACENGSKVVLGFYYLTATSVEHDAVDRRTDDQFVHLDKIPAIYLGMIGVHAPICRLGVGTALMVHAFRRACEIAQSAGVWALILDAVDQEAAAYYERFDFRRFSEGSLEMFLPIGTIQALFFDEESDEVPE